MQRISHMGYLGLADISTTQSLHQRLGERHRSEEWKSQRARKSFARLSLLDKTRKLHPQNLNSVVALKSPEQ